jgi:hypothetical protein
MVAGAPTGGISSEYAPGIDLPARFMATGMAALALVAIAAPWGVTALTGGFYASPLISYVHLMTVGVIASIVIGASYQLVPVVLQTELASSQYGRISFWLHLAGIVLFLPGIYYSWRPGLAIGSILLFAGLLTFTGIIARTLQHAPRLDGVAWHILISLIGLFGGMTMGVGLAFNRTAGFLGEQTLPILAAHASLMLGGWVLLMINGVAYRLVSMFTLTESHVNSKVVITELILSATGIWLFVAALLVTPNRFLLLIPVALVFSGQSLFAGQLIYLYRRRLRRSFDIHMPFALLAAGVSTLVPALIAFGVLTGRTPGDLLWVGVGWLLIAGVAITAIQGFFYKIATFLVWLKRYAPLAGRSRVPRLEEMYSGRLAKAGFGVWLIGLLISLLGLIADSATMMGIAGFVLALGIGCFLGNVVRIASHWRPLALWQPANSQGNETVYTKGGLQ